jgi:hypothetical protein
MSRGLQSELLHLCEENILVGLPDGLKELDIRATKLTEVSDLPDSLKELDIRVTKLTKVADLPDKITHLVLGGTPDPAR